MEKWALILMLKMLQEIMVAWVGHPANVSETRLRLHNESSDMIALLQGRIPMTEFARLHPVGYDESQEGSPDGGD